MPDDLARDLPGDGGRRHVTDAAPGTGALPIAEAVDILTAALRIS
ncbi:hypothetical protein AB0L65_31660 [Nonomuraea sp. NPDC052116]